MTLSTVRMLCAGMAILLGMTAAVLNFWSGAQTKSEQSAAQRAFGAFMDLIEASPWSRLPSLVAARGLRAVEFCVLLIKGIGFVYMPVVVCFVPITLSVFVLVDALALKGAGHVSGRYTIGFVYTTWAILISVIVHHKSRGNRSFGATSKAKDGLFSSVCSDAMPGFVGRNWHSRFLSYILWQGRFCCLRWLA